MPRPTMKKEVITKKEKSRRQKISNKLMGIKRKPFSAAHIEKLRKASTGKVLSLEARRKLSRAFKGRISPMKGRKHSEETKNKMRQRVAWNKGLPGRPQPKGELSPQWKGGLTPIHMKIRNSKEYKLWRKSVFERDLYLCVWCGNNEKVEADHIKPFALFPELRFAIDNGRTLCRKCHLTTNTYGGNTNKKI